MYFGISCVSSWQRDGESKNLEFCSHSLSDRSPRVGWKSLHGEEATPAKGIRFQSVRSRLEEIVADEARARPDRVASGYFLFLVYGRSCRLVANILRMKLSGQVQHDLGAKDSALADHGERRGPKGLQWLYGGMLSGEGA